MAVARPETHGYTGFGCSRESGSCNYSGTCTDHSISDRMDPYSQLGTHEAWATKPVTFHLSETQQNGEADQIARCEGGRRC